MSDKIAEIRAAVEARYAKNKEDWESYESLAHHPDHVVIYGVPLNEGEIQSLRDHLFKVDWKGPSISAIWEMLERGRQSQQEGLHPGNPPTQSQ